MSLKGENYTYPLSTGIGCPRKTLLQKVVANTMSSKLSNKKSKTQSTGFHNLERKILLKIFFNLNELELMFSVCGVCRHWYNVTRNPELWKTLKFKAEKIETVKMCNFLWKCSKLERLSLNDMKNPTTVIRQMCRCNRSVKHLAIKNCCGGENEKIPEDVLRNILHSCRSLESLNLKGTQFSSIRFYHELANLPRLRKLNLSHNKYLNAKHIMAIALNCRNLEEISLTKAPDSPNTLQVSDQDTVFFFKNLSNSLKRIDFDTTGLTAPSFQAILSCPNLERLSLHHASFLTGEIFCNKLTKLRNLKQLRLTHACQLISDHFILLSRARTFDQLNLLDLSGCLRINDCGLRCVLQHCKDKLTHLSLKSCKSMTDLNFVLDNCSKLLYLNIAHAFSPDPLCFKTLFLRVPKLKTLIVDSKTLPDSDLMRLHPCVPKLKLIRSMSEFHEDELPVYLSKTMTISHRI